MAELIKQTTPKARKEYNCMASEWISNEEHDIFAEMTFSEKKILAKAWREKCKILPGQKYIRQCMKEDGELYTYRARIDMHDICLKYIYPYLD